MTPRLRKLALSLHVTASVGWLRAVAVFLVLAVAGLSSQDAQIVRAAYLSMELATWYVLVPLAFASLLTGVVISIGTPWGLFSHGLHRERTGWHLPPREFSLCGSQGLPVDAYGDSPELGGSRLPWLKS